MKLFLFTAGTLAILTILVLAILHKLPGSEDKGFPMIDTAYRVTHPGVKKGDKIRVEISGSGTQYLHFPLESPCAPLNDIAGTTANPPSCTVTANVIAQFVAQYPYYIDPNKNGPTPSPDGRCRACCKVCQFAIRGKSFTGLQQQRALAGTGNLAAEEILIDQTDSGLPVAKPAAARNGQPVKWFRSGTNIGWSIEFTEDKNVCKETTISSAESEICTVTAASRVKPYSYKMTVNKQTSTGLLFVQ